MHPGQALLSLGTSGVLFCPCASFSSAGASLGVHSFCFLPTCWLQMGVLLSATDSLNWLARIVGESCDPKLLLAELGEQIAPPGDVIFLPYLSGERTPHNDAQIRGCFVGLSHQTNRKALAQVCLFREL